MAKPFIFQPVDHGGNLLMEFNDVSRIHGKLAELINDIESGKTCGATEALEMYNEMMCVEAEDLSKKARKLEQTRVNQLYIGEGGLVCASMQR